MGGGGFGPPELIFGIGFALLLRVCDMAAPEVFHNLRFVSLIQRVGPVLHRTHIFDEAG